MVLCIIGAFITLYDKSLAKKRRRRISEATLWWVSLLGGALGVFLTMLFVRHKTAHLSFMLVLPLVIVAQVVLIVSI